jgi:hypothetical protein
LVKSHASEMRTGGQAADILGARSTQNRVAFKVRFDRPQYIRPQVPRLDRNLPIATDLRKGIADALVKSALLKASGRQA